MSDKPILLIFPFGLLSHYLRCIVLAKELANTFEILFLHHPKYESFLSKEGFATFKCATMDETAIIEKARKFDFTWLNQHALEEVYRSQVEVINRFRPAAVLGDAMPTLKMAAEATDVFFISLINGYLSKHFDGVRSLSRTHPAYFLLKNFGKEFTEKLTTIGETLAFAKIHRPFARMRKKYGLSLLAAYPDEMEGDLTLICDLPHFFRQLDLPLEYEVCGPLVYHSAPECKFALDPHKKTLFVTMGSSGDWSRFSFLNSHEYTCFNIVTAGDENAVLRGPHVISRNFVAAEDILPQTDIVLCHAGNGTIYQALAFGVPLMCITSHFEQEWNQDRLCRLGLGFSLEEEKQENYFKRILEWSDKKADSEFLHLAEMIQQSPEKHLKPAAERVKSLVKFDKSTVYKLGDHRGQTGIAI